MKIAFVSTIRGYPWGGADVLWTNLAEAAAARGDRLLLAVSAAVAAHPRVAALVAAGAEVLPLRPPSRALAARAWNRLRARCGGADPIAAGLGRFRPDLAVFSCGGTYDLAFEPAWCGWLRASGTRYRVIANWQPEHPNFGAAEREAAIRVFSGADRIAFLSSRNLAVTRRHLLAPLTQAGVVQLPLRWRPADRTPWPSESEWNLAAVARLEHIKGLDLLLHAAAEALAGADGWRINIYGRGPDEGYLRATAAHLGLASRVRFRGYVADLRAVWADQHLLVSPAIDEGVPMTIPEAMLCGRPVLATAVGGAEDWIAPGHTGFIASSPALPVLACALRQAWEARARWREMGEAAAAAAARRYRPDDYLELLR